MSHHLTLQHTGLTMFRRILFCGKKPVRRPVIFEPITCQQIQRFLRKECITIRAVFGLSYVNAHRGTLDIRIFQSADFPNPQTGRIHKSNHCFLFQSRKRVKKGMYFRYRWDIRQIRVKFPHRELGVVPRFMKNIHGKEPQL